MKWIVSVFVLLNSCLAFAAPEDWMKQVNPNSLGLFVSVSGNCPFQESQLKDRIEGEFLRARINPSKSLLLNLTVNVKCLSVQSKRGNAMGDTASYEVRYGTQTRDGTNVLYESPDYGEILIGGKDVNQFYVDAIRDSVSQALTDYLKANFSNQAHSP